jgi:HSP20 family protein
MKASFMKNSVQTQTENRPLRTGLQAEREYLAPAANISATADEYLIELDMPGVGKEGLEVTVEGNELTIIGRRHDTAPTGTPYYCESIDADYCRSFDLGPDVDTSKIRAEMQQGILRLHLPKSERVKPRKININA